MIYLDNAATTKVYTEVLHLVPCYGTELYFNPSALYGKALEVSKHVETAREQIAKILGCSSGEIVFTGGGSESDNMAIFGCCKNKNKKVLTSVTEHAAVYQCVQELKNRGFQTEFLRADANGGVDFADFERKMTPDTQFVSVMHVNNETGAINPIKKIAAAAHAVNPKCIVHSDGVQAYGKTAFDVEDLGVDLYSFSGHKIHCFKGVGGLYIKKGVHVPPLIYGGGQERGLRSGTENTGGIVAFGLASQLIYQRRNESDAMFCRWKTMLIEQISEHISDIRINSPLGATSNNILNVSVAGIKAEVVMHMLEEQGILIGLGSACAARHRNGRITQAIGLPEALAEGTLRISFSEFNTSEEIEFFANALIAAVQKLRDTMRRKF